jgi:hypothetical protein
MYVSDVGNDEYSIFHSVAMMDIKLLKLSMKST